MSDGDLVVTNAERDQAVSAIRAAAVDGRLTLDDLTSRTDAALSARTRGDLEAVTHDLGTTVSAPAPAARGATTWLVGVLGHSTRGGRWRAEGQVNVAAFIGHCEIDLRNAQIVGSDLTINVGAVVGHVDIIVPEGVPVELNDVAILGHNEDLRPYREPVAGTPTVHVRGIALVGHVSIYGDEPGMHQRVSGPLLDRRERRRLRREARHRLR